MLSWEVTNTNFIVFGLTRSELEPTIYPTRGEHANHYTTDAVGKLLIRSGSLRVFQIWFLICLIYIYCRYASRLVREESDEVVPFGVAIGDTELLINNFTNRGQMFEAVLTAQVACEGTFLPQQNSCSTSGLSNGTDKPSKQEDKYVR